jgi:anthranilate phosphoribosyltransferase
MTVDNTSVDMVPFLARVAEGATLSESEAERAFSIIMDGGATPAQIGAFLMALRVRGETDDEIIGAVRVMRAKSARIDAPVNAVDIVGTGGDGADTLNISTAAALVVAGAGVTVAKHGNRAVSSQCGSADVLSALGVTIDVERSVTERAFREARIGFMLAPRYHPAMKAVVLPRRELGVRTVFNLLGPLSNPAGVTRQFTGAFHRRWLEPMARVLLDLGSERAWVVHGSDGLDEITITGPTHVAEVRDGRIRTFDITPGDAGLATAGLESIKGGDAQLNAAHIRALLDGEPGPFRDTVALNAAAALIVADRCSSLIEGVALATRTLDDGSARGALDRLVAITGESA